jgi:hypothetical protein
MAQIHASVTLLMSRDLAWNSGQLKCQHASQISVVAHISWDVTYVSSALQTLPVVSRNGGNAYWKKCANGHFYMTLSHQIIEISMRANAWEGIGKELKIKRKFYVSSRDVRIVCPRFKVTSHTARPVHQLHIYRSLFALSANSTSTLAMDRLHDSPFPQVTSRHHVRLWYFPHP